MQRQQWNCNRFQKIARTCCEAWRRRKEKKKGSACAERGDAGDQHGAKTFCPESSQNQNQNVYSKPAEDKTKCITSLRLQLGNYSIHSLFVVGLAKTLPRRGSDAAVLNSAAQKRVVEPDASHCLCVVGNRLLPHNLTGICFLDLVYSSFSIKVYIMFLSYLCIHTTVVLCQT